jgi:hypothetical protein
MMKEIEEQKRLKMEHQKYIDEAIKAGPYFKKEPHQLKEALPVLEVSASELPALEVQTTQTQEDSNVEETSSLEAA